jgi:hypothetical protein
MKNSLIGIATLVVVSLHSGPASAQTVENAYTFFDQVMTNNATAIELDGYDQTPVSSVSGQCKSEVRAPRYDSYPLSRVTIDWVKAVEVTETATKNPLTLKIIGGVSATLYYEDGSTDYNDSGPINALHVITGAESMNVRLTKAMKMIIDACADKSTGF